MLLAILAIAPIVAEAQCRPGTGLDANLPLQLTGLGDTLHFDSPILDRPPEDFSWKDFSWPYARGRAILSTAAPVAVGGTLLGLAPDGRQSTALGLAVGGVGLLAGPSMGQWCLGGDYATESILHTTARAAAMGGLVWTLTWGEQQIEEAPLALFPGTIAAVGVVVVVVGGVLLKTVLWTIGETPRRACDSDRRNSSVALSPTVDPQTRSGGVHLSVRF